MSISLQAKCAPASSESSVAAASQSLSVTVPCKSSRRILAILIKVMAKTCLSTLLIHAPVLHSSPDISSGGLLLVLEGVALLRVMQWDRGSWLGNVG